MEEKAKFSASYTDSSGETTEMNKTYNDDTEEVDTIWFLLDEFKCFLKAYGFADFQVENVIWLEPGWKVLDDNGELVHERKQL
jgi:hypothetical protein